ncbi:hypothetical protein [Pseudolysinimonas sp.]|uniref:hypothetical protein n=1 Tax=Pseudolysinimonas sp. TaxID=2680009 RepID=UPI003F7F24B5
MSDLEELLRGRVAHGVLLATMGFLRRRWEVDGSPFPSWAKPVLEALAVAANQPDPDMSEFGRAVGTMDSTNWVTVREAARLVGRSERHVRRLAQERRVRSQRENNWLWLVDIDSLKNVLERSNVEGRGAGS